MLYKCNSTFYCNITTIYKNRGTCIEYQDCETFPCQVTGCKPTIEPVPGFCEEVGCYIIEKPSSENYLTIALSSGFGVICLLVLLVILHKRDVLKVNRLRVVGTNMKLCLQQSIANLQLCIIQGCILKCMSGLGWVLDNVPSCGFLIRAILYILECLCCCVKNQDTEENESLVSDVRYLPLDDSIQFSLHSANIQEPNSRLPIPYQPLPCQSIANQNYVSSSPEDLNLPHPADKRSAIIKKKKKVKQPSSYGSYVSRELRPPSSNSESPGRNLEYDEEIV